MRNASEKAEKIEYNYSVRNDTLLLDSYFGLPETSRWGGSILVVNIYIPEGSAIYIDESISELIDRARTADGYSWEMGGRWYVMKDEILTTSK